MATGSPKPAGDTESADSKGGNEQKGALDARVKCHERTHGDATLYGFVTRYIRGAVQQTVITAPTQRSIPPSRAESESGDGRTFEAADHTKHKGESAAEKEGEAKDRASPKGPETKKPGEDRAEGKEKEKERGK